MKAYGLRNKKKNKKIKKYRKFYKLTLNLRVYDFMLKICATVLQPSSPKLLFYLHRKT